MDVGMAAITRRTVLTGAAVATGATALGVGGYESLRKPDRNEPSMDCGGNKPNMVIVVDQMRDVVVPGTRETEYVAAQRRPAAHEQRFFRVPLHCLEHVHAIAK